MTPPAIEHAHSAAYCWARLILSPLASGLSAGWRRWGFILEQAAESVGRAPVANGCSSRYHGSVLLFSSPTLAALSRRSFSESDSTRFIFFRLSFVHPPFPRGLRPWPVAIAAPQARRPCIFSVKEQTASPLAPLRAVGGSPPPSGRHGRYRV